MKRFTYITAILVAAIVVSVVSCDSKRQPGKIYMPDMTYSRAYESYAEHDTTKFTMDINDKGGDKIFYNSMPPSGTLKRGELYPYPLSHDTNNYKISGTVKNPIDSLNKDQLAEAGRLFNINCAICHGEKGGGNGPLSSKIGAIANLTLPNYVAMQDGQMFYSITYGKNDMGSYASQLTRAQRWSIIKYVRTLQPKAAAATAATTAPAKTDSTATKAK
jgi:mono/diheme cytochrome c family protein